MNFSHKTQSQLPPVVVRAESDIIRARMQALGELAGIDVLLVSPADSVTGGVLIFDEEYGVKVPSIRAHFHPSYAAYFTEGSIVLDVEEEAGDIVELMIAAGATSRGTVIGFLASHGGAGSTTLACSLGRHFASSLHGQSIALMDCDPVSAGVESWCGLSSSGISWADLSDKTGTLMPGRLAKALPKLDNLHVLTGDGRGGMPHSGELPTQAITALSQSHDITLMDFPRSVLTNNTDLLTWCDTLVLVTDTSSHAVSQSLCTMNFIQRIIPNTPIILVVNRVSGGAQAASIAFDIGIDTVAPIRTARALSKDLEHGVPLGERPRSAMNKDIKRLATILNEVR